MNGFGIAWPVCSGSSGTRIGARGSADHNRWRHHQAQRTTYRLWGIDAPETRQACADGWEAGPEARRKLAELIGVNDVICEARGLDRYRRTMLFARRMVRIWALRW